jgi:hypothetical protein
MHGVAAVDLHCALVNVTHLNTTMGVIAQQTYAERGIAAWFKI